MYFSSYINITTCLRNTNKMHLMDTHTDPRLSSGHLQRIESSVVFFIKLAFYYLIKILSPNALLNVTPFHQQVPKLKGAEEVRRQGPNQTKEEVKIGCLYILN